jgi:hypothetical protein
MTDKPLLLKIAELKYKEEIDRVYLINTKTHWFLGYGLVIFTGICLFFFDHKMINWEWATFTLPVTSLFSVLLFLNVLRPKRVAVLGNIKKDIKKYKETNNTPDIYIENLAKASRSLNELSKSKERRFKIAFYAFVFSLLVLAGTTVIYLIGR